MVRAGSGRGASAADKPHRRRLPAQHSKEASRRKQVVRENGVWPLHTGPPDGVYHPEKARVKDTCGEESSVRTVGALAGAPVRGDRLTRAASAPTGKHVGTYPYVGY